MKDRHICCDFKVKKRESRSPQVVAGGSLRPTLQYESITDPSGQDCPIHSLGFLCEPALKMLNKMIKSRWKTTEGSYSPSELQTIRPAFNPTALISLSLSLITCDWTNIHIDPTFSQCVQCTWVSSSWKKGQHSRKKNERRDKRWSWEGARSKEKSTRREVLLYLYNYRYLSHHVTTFPICLENKWNHNRQKRGMRVNVKQRGVACTPTCQVEVSPVTQSIQHHEETEETEFSPLSCI